MHLAGANLNITEHGPKISSSELLDIETRLGHTLPTEYRLFLLLCNGGVPVPCGFQLKHSSGPYTEDAVEVLYGLSSAPDGLWPVFENFVKQGLPNEYLIIGRIVGGLPLCIKLAGPDTGSIYLWNWERGYAFEVIDYGFDAFLAGLYYLSPQEPNPINILLANNNVQAIRGLITNGWDVNDYPSGGLTPLEHAIFFNHRELAEVLLDHGARLGRSIELAKRRGYLDILELLLERIGQ